METTQNLEVESTERMRPIYINICMALALGVTPLMSNAADFNYSDNQGFQKKYPDLACVDTGELTPQEIQDFGTNADRLQQLGEAVNVPYTRPPCLAENKEGAPVATPVSGSEFLDRLYSRLTSGPIPHGFFRGRVVLPRDKGLRSLRDVGMILPGDAFLQKVAQQLWSGKYLDKDRMFLLNRINLDGVQDVPPTKLEDPKMKFPAKVYCGQSLFDSRRESIIIDYMFGEQDRPPGIPFDASLEWLSGPKGLKVRDEIRMVRPGLYLGRAYMQGVFGLYFILEYVPGTGREAELKGEDACWVGHQRQRARGFRGSEYVNRAAN